MNKKVTTDKSKETYIEAVGRRKTSTARVRIREGSKANFIVNGKDAKEYFKTEGEKRLILDPMIKGLTPAKAGLKWNIEVHVKGGGIHSQAEAIRHGLSRALVSSDISLREGLKKLGYLKRDPRAKERRKFGLKKARKAPQWSKR
ncbi:30S ribosomal protein S9 [Candidatus Nomurabacteria bacterium RIFCSPHIGHO2_02_FULL_37_45]|uniref:Small ribosomal subunit protein uS9 n=2 Tax=Candidatus Nomuraibacteriota TaxID=1752729 RepID=A0A1F6Y3N8_9BACT|nr:MAG: 30S ribosomal protein S9 [Candidatus Nomurabacteria bacterium RIFCSPHIGHO2_01_FULL_37_110]OGI71297.1 MAG: 30S ribosomal protein S9 [Candidatus Nomurabacteria bacterium RIFCSPHIGHO2_02_FULL_37_45]OGI79525.1 MAG: 30S ribosomal protein S9 [Candidatus Nomurabacteria bacterium RIFCSPHIGHO2_12_FULL_37_29]OGI85408.1 MAG: 30S ribosomal protein S9 [Candidatus Nomurabacteria bacterium RIFCSPLOWO2_01_FULL_37_49]OGJ00998.1 MAG: 30S ribosomal protein S9 [Candidatus Nomurabacteria bacterium RIFCSPLOW